MRLLINSRHDIKGISNICRCIFVQTNHISKIKTKVDFPTTSIIVPCFNEAGRLGASLEKKSELLKNNYLINIIFVNDGSIDNTEEILNQYLLDSNIASRNSQIRIVNLRSNQGKGRAVYRGIQLSDAEIICFVDADFPINIEDLNTIITTSFKQRALVCSSRYLETSNITITQPKRRIIASKIFRTIIKYYAKVPIKDTQCGIKAFPKEYVSDIASNMKISGFAFDLELILRAQQANIKIVEQAITWTNGEGSSVNIFKDSLQMLRDVHKLKKSGL
jgi:glycosyltransferase involved in cell wall biosynthesis